MKLNFLLFNGLKTDLFAALLGLLALPISMQALPAPKWMHGGHAARITGVACAPDGTLVASASEDGTIKLWSTNGTLLKTLTAQISPITAVAWSPDGKTIAGGSYVANVAGRGLTYFWQAPDGWLADTVNLARITTNRFGYVTALAFSPDSTLLASGCNGGSNIVYSVANGSVVKNLPAYNPPSRPGAVTSVAFSTSGMIASGCEEATIRVYNSAGALLWNSATNTDSHMSNVTAVAFSPDGSRLATASLDRTVKIRSTSNWTLQQTLSGSAGGVLSTAFSPDGNKIVCGYADGTIKVWNWPNGECVLTNTAHALPVTTTVFSTDGKTLLSGSDDNTIGIWSANDGSTVCRLGAQINCISVATISPDGKWCATAGEGQFIQVRQTSDGALVRTLTGNTNFVSSMAFSSDSAVLASGGGPLDPVIKLWRISDGTLLRTIAATTNGVMAMAWSPDGATLSSGGDSIEQVIRLWRVADGALQHTMAGHSNGVTTLSFSPDGKLLASGGRRYDHTIKVWNVGNGSLIRSLRGHSNNIESLAFGPDGSFLASGSSGAGSLKVWQLSDGSYRNLGTGTNSVAAVVFSPDGSILASTDRDSIKFWNVAAGTLKETITQNTYRVTSFAYSPNGNLFLYGREDAAVVLSTNIAGAMKQQPLSFLNVSPLPTGSAGFSASVQPWTRHIIEFSSNLLEWTFLMQASGSNNTLSIIGAPITNSPSVFLRALTPP